MTLHTNDHFPLPTLGNFSNGHSVTGTGDDEDGETSKKNKWISILNKKIYIHNEQQLTIVIISSINWIGKTCVGHKKGAQNNCDDALHDWCKTTTDFSAITDAFYIIFSACKLYARNMQLLITIFFFVFSNYFSRSSTSYMHLTKINNIYIVCK